MLKSSDVDVVCYWPAWSLTAMLEDLVVLLQFDVTFEDDTVSLWLAMAGVATVPGLWAPREDTIGHPCVRIGASGAIYICYANPGILSWPGCLPGADHHLR